MSVAEDGREASATIRGYLYQFDATILSIVGLSARESVEVEAIEDFDVASADMTEIFQCKYHEAIRLTNSSMRDAVVPMIRGFLLLGRKERGKRRFHLYGHYGGTNVGDRSISVEELKKSLVRRVRRVRDGSAQYSVIDLQKELGATDEDLADFVRMFVIHVTEEYSVHRARVVNALKGCCGTSQEEAEGFLYPSARTIVSDMASSRKLAERRISKRDFVARIRPSRALLSAWYLRELGERRYCSSIRSTYFSHQNVDASHRVFVIECSSSLRVRDVLSICHEIRRKWSSHAIRRKPAEERYAPFLYLRGFSKEDLVALKTKLRRDGVGFVDGYSFLGSDFELSELCEPQTRANGLSLRIISSDDDFKVTLGELRGRTFIYDFYVENPMRVIGDHTQVSIPVFSAGMIEKMI